MLCANLEVKMQCMHAIGNTLVFLSLFFALAGFFFIYIKMMTNLDVFLSAIQHL